MNHIYLNSHLIAEPRDVKKTKRKIVSTFQLFNFSTFQLFNLSNKLLLIHNSTIAQTTIQKKQKQKNKTKQKIPKQNKTKHTKTKKINFFLLCFAISS